MSGAEANELDTHSPQPSATLLAVDLGLTTGWALFGVDGRLRWCRSHHFADRDQLRRAVRQLLRQIDGLQWLVIEGGGPIAEIWSRVATRQGVQLIAISAEDWRVSFFHPTQMRGRDKAKSSAERLARRVIEWSSVAQPSTLRNDTAEAVLIGLWGVLHVGWLAGAPV